MDPWQRSMENRLSTLHKTLNALPLPASASRLQTKYAEVREEVQTQQVKLPSIRNKPTESRQREFRRPAREVMTEQRARTLVSMPSTEHGRAFLLEKFNLPPSRATGSRSQGGVSYGRPPPTKLTQAKVVPTQFRYDPYSEPPITQQDIDQGVFNLVNKGLVPKNADLSPAFHREFPTFSYNKAPLHQWEDRTLQPELLPPQPMVQYESPKRNQIDFSDEESIPALPQPFEPVRTYEEVMDTHSSFHLFIRKGRILTNTPEFASFKRTYQQNWGQIQQAFRLAERYFTQHGIPLVYLDGKQLAQIVCDELRQPNIESILHCLSNPEQVLPALNHPGYKFRCPIGKHLAAQSIQSHWRGYKAYSAYQQLRALIRKATMIQTRYRLYRAHQRTRVKIREQYESKLEIHKKQQEEFIEIWPEMRRRPRVEIHINSIPGDMSVVSPDSRQNGQFARVCRVGDPDIEVIYVSPCRVPDEVVDGYLEVIGQAGVDRNKVTVIAPTIRNALSEHIATSLLLYCSVETLLELNEIIGEREAYIVPGRLTRYEILLSVYLKLPIFAGDIEKVQLYQLKSGGRRIFDLSGLPTAPGASEITSEQEIIQTLANLICQELFIDTWLFKIDSEYQGRGIAYLDLVNFRLIKELRKNYKQAPDPVEVREFLTHILSDSIRFAMPSMHKDWADYLEKFLRHGGVIEATPPTQRTNITSPRVSFILHPQGDIEYIAAFDRIPARDFLNSGAFFPQTSLPHADMMEICQDVSEVLLKRGVWGYITIDLTAFPDPINEAGKPIFWALDLEIGLNSLTSSFFYFHLLQGGRTDIRNGQYYIKAMDEMERRPERDPWNIPMLKESSDMSEDMDDINKFEPRGYMYAWELRHPDLNQEQWGTFMYMCRYESLDYDDYQARGVMFLLYNTLNAHHVGLMTIGINRNEVIRFASEAFTFILQHIGPPPQPLLSFDGAPVEDFALSDVISRVKGIYKRMQQRKKAAKKSYIVDI